MRETLGTDSLQRSRSKRREKAQQFGDQRLEGLKPVCVRHQHDDRHGQLREVLLELDVLVSSEDDVEGVRSLRQERAVLQSRPSQFGDGADLVASQQLGEGAWERLIEEDAHSWSEAHWLPRELPPLAPA